MDAMRLVNRERALTRELNRLHTELKKVQVQLLRLRALDEQRRRLIPAYEV